MKVHKVLFVVLIAFSVLLIGIVAFFHFDGIKTEYFYDFESDAINSFPTGFMGVGRSTDDIRVVKWNISDGHEGKVVHVSYLEENDYGGIELNTLFNKAIKGFILFDVYIKHDLHVKIDVCQEDTIYDPVDDISISINRISLIEILKWYRFEVNFNCQENEWNIKIYREGTLIKFDAYNFSVQPSYMCQLYFATYELDCEFYIDNVYILLETLL